jgi:dihydroneopterin aldolase/2-amino-4-hydroxy-6-hydroxymethyldihydropteridine diphosphokinase
MTTGPASPASPDRIRLLGVQAVGHHGVLDLEKQDGQAFVVDVVLELDLSLAGRSDSLDDTVSYAEVAGDVVARITGPSFDLIERLAEVVAADVLARPLVSSVEVTVHKPQAPVGHPFTDVQVQVRRERGVPVVLALGANLGDVVAVLTEAVADVGAIPGMRVVAVSPLVETDPVGGPDQPLYLNAVLLGTTTLPPRELLEALHAIETRHGRTRDVRWGARTLDLDLVQLGVPGTGSEVRSDDPALVLPHPRAHERAFVLSPWALVDGSALIRTGPGPDAPIRKVADVLDEVDASGVRPGPEWRPTW